MSALNRLTANDSYRPALQPTIPTDSVRAKSVEPSEIGVYCLSFRT